MEGVPSMVKEFPRKAGETNKPDVMDLELPKILCEAEKALKPAVDNITESPGSDGQFSTNYIPDTDGQFSTNEVKGTGNKTSDDGSDAKGNKNPFQVICTQIFCPSPKMKTEMKNKPRLSP